MIILGCGIGRVDPLLSNRFSWYVWVWGIEGYCIVGSGIRWDVMGSNSGLACVRHGSIFLILLRISTLCQIIICITFPALSVCFLNDNSSILLAIPLYVFFYQGYRKSRFAIKRLRIQRPTIYHFYLEIWLLKLCSLKLQAGASLFMPSIKMIGSLSRYSFWSLRWHGI